MPRLRAQLPARLRPWLVLVAALGATGASAAHGASLSGLQSQLSASRSRAAGLSTSVSNTGGAIARLEGQISLVESRAATVRAMLGREQAALTRTQGQLGIQRARLARLRRALARAQDLLATQLRSGYEGDRPDLVTVILSAHGFNDLLEQLDFLRRAETEQQSLIAVTRLARAQAQGAADRLAATARAEHGLAAAAAVQARALAGMDALLAGQQAALARVQAAQRTALAATEAQSQSLRGQIGQIEAQQAAAARAAAAAAAAGAAASSSSSNGSSAAGAGPGSGSGSAGSLTTGPALGPSGGWAIPYAIVLCESGGQNLPPNSAGASGYYQILPSTWTLYGGSGPAAYLAPKSEQDAVASRIWAGGAGASQWVCAGIVGIH